MSLLAGTCDYSEKHIQRCLDPYYFFSVGTLCSSFFSLSCLSRQKPLQIITQAAHSGAVYNSMTSDGHHHLVDLFILMVLLCGNVKQQQYDIQS